MKKLIIIAAILILAVSAKAQTEEGLTIIPISDIYYNVGVGTDGKWHELINTTVDPVKTYALMFEVNICDFSTETLPEGWVRTATVSYMKEPSKAKILAEKDVKLSAIRDSYGNVYVEYVYIKGTPEIIGTH